MKKLNYTIAIITTLTLLVFVSSCTKKKECQEHENALENNKNTVHNINMDVAAGRIHPAEAEAQLEMIAQDSETRADWMERFCK